MARYKVVPAKGVRIESELPLTERLREHSRPWPMTDAEMVLWANVAMELMREAAGELESRD